MTAEERVKKFIETLLVRIHWQGERSEHPSDVKWLAQRVESLTAEVAPIILDAQREAEESMRKRCADAMLIMPNGMMPPHFRLGAAEARQIIRYLVPSIYLEAAQP